MHLVNVFNCNFQRFIFPAASSKQKLQHILSGQVTSPLNFPPSPHLFLRVPGHFLAPVRPLLVPCVEHAHHLHRLSAPPAIARGDRVRFGRVGPQRGRDRRVRVQVVVHDAEIAAETDLRYEMGGGV